MDGLDRLWLPVKPGSSRNQECGNTLESLHIIRRRLRKQPRTWLTSIMKTGHWSLKEIKKEWKWTKEFVNDRFRTLYSRRGHNGGGALVAHCPAFIEDFRETALKVTGSCCFCLGYHKGPWKRCWWCMEVMWKVTEVWCWFWSDDRDRYRTLEGEEGTSDWEPWLKEKTGNQRRYQLCWCLYLTTALFVSGLWRWLELSRMADGDTSTLLAKAIPGYGYRSVWPFQKEKGAIFADGAC